MKIRTRIVCIILSVMLLASLLTVPSSAATMLPQAVKGGTAKTPTAAQQAQLATEFPGIVCYGDSLTQGVKYTAQGQNYKSYVRHLGELVASNLITGYDAINKTVNFGINGDKSANITARSGAVAAETATVMNLAAAAGSSAPISLRLSTTKAAIQWVALTNACETAYGGVNGKTQPNITIDGIEGRIGYVGGKLSFIRNSAGAAKTWAAGTKVTYEFATSYSNYVPVIFMGYNDGPEWINANYNNYKTYLESIIKKYNAGRTEMRYVIVVPHFTDRCFLPDARYWGTPYSAQTLVTIKNIENNLIRDFGADHVVKAREFMVSYGLSETNLNPTAEDTKRINAGAVPASLLNAYEAVLNKEGTRTCYTHFNDVGNQLLARLIYQKMYDQGAFDKVIDIMGLNIPKSNGGSGGGLTHTHSMTYTAAKAATCKAAGNTAYYYCAGCSGYFTDAAGTKQTTLAATVVPKLTTHSPGAAASCSSPQLCTACGIVITAQKSHSYNGTYSSDINGHWFTCTACGSKGTVNVHINTTENGVTKCVLCNYSQHSHVMTQVPAKAATCRAEGNIAHYKCTICGLLYSDAGGANEITAASVILAKSSHTFGSALTGDASGHYNACSVCGEKGTVNVHIPNVQAATESTAKYCVLCNYIIEAKLEPSHTHSMVMTAAKAATCSSTGNIAYYSCASCGKYFSNAQGTAEISLASTVLAKTAHSFGTALTGDASGHYTKCTVCSEKGAVSAHVPNVQAATSTTDKYCVLCNFVIENKLTDGVVGDANNDGTKNIADVNYMLNYILFGEAQYPKHQDMDYNKDGKINTSDATVLLNSVIFGTI